MYCKHCGNLLDDDSKFCDKCGKYITDKPDEIQNKQGHTIKRKNIILIALVTIVCAVIISGLCIISSLQSKQKPANKKSRVN